MNNFILQIRYIFNSIVKKNAKTSRKHSETLNQSVHKLNLISPTVAHINQLPNELIRLILSQLEWPKLIHLRAVCTRWQVLIESMGTTTKSLMVTNVALHNQLGKRSFGQINSQDFIKIKMKRLDCTFKSIFDFGLLLCRVFPNVEQLAIGSIIPCQYFLLDLWSPQLITLSLFGLMSQENNPTDLAFVIGSLASLKQLDLERYSSTTFKLLPSTLSQLTHYSYYCNIISSHFSYSYSPNHIHHLGRNCTRLWLDDYFLCSTDVQQWHLINPEWLANLTHVSFMMQRGHDQVLSYLCSHCPMLQVLRLNGHIPPPVKLTCELITNLSKLTHLTEFEHGRLELDLDKLEKWIWNGKLQPLSTIRVCSLSIQCTGEDLLSLERLKSAIDAIFPNAKRLYIRDYLKQTLM